MGTVRIDAAGAHRLTLRAEQINRNAPMGLCVASVQLRAISPKVRS